MTFAGKYSLSIVSTLFLVILNGCGGEFSYKRGAGPTDFQNEKSRCNSDYNNNDDVNSCLEEKGWVVVSPDKPLFVETTHSDNRVLSEQPSKHTQTITAAEPVKLNPLDKVEIGSWWKGGASPKQLLTDGQLCAKTLGEPHSAEKNMSLVTIGIVKCMRDKGWYALKK